MTTIQQALAQGISRDIDHFDAQLLLAHALQVERSTLYAYPERELTPAQEQQFLALIERRLGIILFLFVVIFIAGFYAATKMF